MEVLAAYSHNKHVADLQLCVNASRKSVSFPPTSEIKRPWRLRERIDERTRVDMIAAYRAGTTAASLATTHGLSPRSVKRLLAAAGARRKQRLPA